MQLSEIYLMILHQILSPIIQVQHSQYYVKSSICDLMLCLKNGTNKQVLNLKFTKFLKEVCLYTPLETAAPLCGVPYKVFSPPPCTQKNFHLCY